MASGRPRKGVDASRAGPRRGRPCRAQGPRPRRARGPGLRRARPAALALVLLSILALSACGDSRSAFQGFRRKLDTALSRPDARAERYRLFAQAGKAARTPTEWLSLLARARTAEYLGDAGRYENIADKAIAFGTSVKSSSGAAVLGADVARAAADAYLTAGKPAKALALFGPWLSAEDDPSLWTVAVVKALRAGTLPEALRTPATYDRLALTLREPALGVDAALLSLEEGDFLAAGQRLRTALAAGARVGAELQWDAGLYADLAGRADAKVTASELRLMADASWLMGDPSTARVRWARAIKDDPRGSWRSYASLAAVSGESLPVAGEGDLAFLRSGSGSAAAKAQTRAGFVGSALAQSAPAREPSRYAAMIAAFPRDTGARTAWAAALVRSGRGAEALAFLELDDKARAASSSRDLARRLAVGEAVWPEGRAVSEAVRLAGERPGDPLAVGEALGLLLSRGAWTDFLVLESKAEAGGLEWEHRGFHSAVAATLRGRRDEAVALFESARAGEAGPAVPWALAALAAPAEPERKEALLEEALARAALPAERCLIYKELGRLAEGRGNPAKAREAWKAAAAADPSDAEAARLARQ